MFFPSVIDGMAKHDIDDATLSLSVADIEFNRSVDRALAILDLLRRPVHLRARSIADLDAAVTDNAIGGEAFGALVDRYSQGPTQHLPLRLRDFQSHTRSAVAGCRADGVACDARTGGAATVIKGLVGYL